MFFYSSAGTAWLDKRPLLETEGEQIGLEWGQLLMQRVLKRCEELTGNCYLEMEKKQENTDTPFSEACQKILVQFPVAIGVAYKVLDCGCALLCGMTAGGEPVGALQHISGQPIRKGARIPICLKCKIDNGLNRVVWEGIYWPGTQTEWPDKDIRIAIGREVFGPGYREPE